MSEIPFTHNFVKRLLEGEKQLANFCLFAGKLETPGISLLLGAEERWQVLKNEVVQVQDQKLLAINSRLGWTFQGPTDESCSLI